MHSADFSITSASEIFFLVKKQIPHKSSNGDCSQIDGTTRLHRNISFVERDVAPW